MKENTGRVFGRRGKISSYSYHSHRRAKTIFLSLASKFSVVAHLTYPGEYVGLLDGKQTKAHLRVLLNWLLRNVGRDLVYAWVLEFQKNGNPHYHVLLSHYVDKDVLADRWAKIVGSGLEKHRNAGTRVEEIEDQDRCAAYVVDYLTKGSQKIVPGEFADVGRFWGYSRGSVELVRDEIREYPDLHAAKRDTRTMRRARSAKLREFGIRWRPGGAGYTDVSLGMGAWVRLLDMMGGKVIPGLPEVIPKLPPVCVPDEDPLPLGIPGDAGEVFAEWERVS